MTSAKTTRITKFSADEGIFLPDDRVEAIWSEELYQREMRAILLPIIETLTFDDDTDIFDDLSTSNYSLEDVNNIFSIEPSQGFLMSYEYVVANISFSPPPNVDVKIVATLNVDDGDKEKIIIRGCTSPISYKFEPEYVEFNRRVCKIIIKRYNNKKFIVFYFFSYIMKYQRVK